MLPLKGFLKMHKQCKYALNVCTRMVIESKQWPKYSKMIFFS
jgi:hypothetical protein